MGVHWVQADSYYLPKPISGHPALEFCNTRAGWDVPMRPELEWLRGYDTFVVWSKHTGLIDDVDVERLTLAARKEPERGASVLDAARELRAALYPTLLDRDRAGFATVAEFAERTAGLLRLTETSEGPAEWRVPEDTGLELPLHAVAQAAAELLCSPDRALVKACPGEDCGWLFLDRRGRRRWCIMATCGNRAKARAFAERQRE